MHDKAVKRDINDLEIRCTKQGLGCQWVGELSSLQTHLDSDKGCGYVAVQCSNKCGAKMKRKELKAHLERQCLLRKIQCQYCSYEDTYRTITNRHYGECPHYPLPCPNKCGTTGIRRADMDNHRSRCELEPVECPFREAGCKVHVVRKEFDSHMSGNQQMHLLVLLGAYQGTKRELGENQRELDECLGELDENRRELDGNRRELDENQRELYECQTELVKNRRELDGNRKELDECQRELVKNRRELDGNRRELDENRRELDENRRELDECQRELVKNRKELDDSQTKLHNTRLKLLQFEEIQYKQMTLKVIGNEVLFCMYDYSLYRQTGKVWYSPPFYYGDGYKLCLAVYANGKGDGEGTHVSVELLLMKGGLHHQQPIQHPYQYQGSMYGQSYQTTTLISISMVNQSKKALEREFSLDHHICSNCFLQQSSQGDLCVFWSCYSRKAVSSDQFIEHEIAEQVVLNNTISLRVSLNSKDCRNSGGYW